jgi:hypothetical protein
VRRVAVRWKVGKHAAAPLFGSDRIGPLTLTVISASDPVASGDIDASPGAGAAARVANSCKHQRNILTRSEKRSGRRWVRRRIGSVREWRSTVLAPCRGVEELDHGGERACATPCDGRIAVKPRFLGSFYKGSGHTRSSCVPPAVSSPDVRISRRIDCQQVLAGTARPLLPASSNLRVLRLTADTIFFVPASPFFLHR